MSDELCHQRKRRTKAGLKPKLIEKSTDWILVASTKFQLEWLGLKNATIRKMAGNVSKSAISPPQFQHRLLKWSFSQHRLLKWSFSQHRLLKWSLSQHRLLKWSLCQHRLLKGSLWEHFFLLKWSFWALAWRSQSIQPTPADSQQAVHKNDNILSGSDHEKLP